jgi:hypothetical protein
LKKEAEARAKKFNIPPGLMSGVIEQESSWNGYKSGKNKNGTLDSGLTQINQVNWPRFKVTSAEELGTDPLRAIDIGATLLRESIDVNGGNLFLAVSAYQRGQGNLNKTLRGESEVPAVARDYPIKVLMRAAKYGAPMPEEGDLASAAKRLGYQVDLEKARKAAGITNSDLRSAKKVDDKFILPDNAQRVKEAEAVAQIEFETPVPVDTPPMLAVTDDVPVTDVPTPAPPSAPTAAPMLDESLLAIDEELNQMTAEVDKRRKVAEAFGGSVRGNVEPSGDMEFIDAIVDGELENV